MSRKSEQKSNGRGKENECSESALERGRMNFNTIVHTVRVPCASCCCLSFSCSRRWTENVIKRCFIKSTRRNAVQLQMSSLHGLYLTLTYSLFHSLNSLLYCTKDLCRSFKRTFPRSMLLSDYPSINLHANALQY